MSEKLHAKLDTLKRMIERDKCFMCKHRFDEPLLLPVDEVVPGKFQPRFNPEFLFHVTDTHGIPADIFRDWVVGSIYGLTLTEFGVRL